MRLFIAEKPSLARAIAAVLPGPPQRRDGYLQCGSDDVVAWCAGHILELAAPDAYDPAFKQWRLEHLPITPKDWRLAISAPELLKTIKALLRKATRVVHAGDPDREGQLLIDEVLAFLGYRGPVDRLLISDLNPPAIRKALSEVQSNARYRGLSDAALARQRADWLYGINLTRLYTLLGRAGGYDGVLSVGRVQTPLLGLIVRRDLEIERFHPRTYYVPQATVRCAAGEFTAFWQPPEDAAGITDEDRRLTSREHALAIQRRAAGAAGVVARCSREKRSAAPPLPYSLPDLQVDAGTRLGLGPKQVLDACQSLYETHRLLTYPRSDCPYLPVGQHDQATAVLAAVATNMPSLLSVVGQADRSHRSRAWNDNKVTAHHAIIPTVVARPTAGLSPAERGVYELVARRYVAQFFPAFEFHETTIEIAVGLDRFRVHGRETIAEGWRVPFGKLPPEQTGDDRQGAEDEDEGQALPVLRDGEALAVGEVAIGEKQTTPPRRFTEAGLIQAMTGIARYVDDPKIKEILRESDGIGTPATQAQIIETLLERRFIEKQRKQVVSTPIGRALIQALPEVATRPDMTAVWEAAMRRISEGQMPLDTFLAAVVKQLGTLVVSGRALGTLRVPLQSYAPGVSRVPRRRSTARRASGGHHSGR